MALIKYIIVVVSLTLILYYLSFRFEFSKINSNLDSSPLVKKKQNKNKKDYLDFNKKLKNYFTLLKILNTRESSLLNDEDKKEEEEWMYLSSMKINFSFAGFSSSTYTEKLKQVLEC